ncbi:MAG: NUDIX domain-containing protein [Saprospiraceae bacterium]|nr:NUDIX domain-containing protein [Saprospiraceae bacterium]
MSILNNFIYKSVITTIYKFRKIYWRLIKPMTSGVRCLIFNENNQVLLVKHFYSNEWYLPGGAINYKESPQKALLRELREECGIYNLIDLKQLNVYTNNFESKKDTIFLFTAYCEKTDVKFNFEIENIKFFNLDNLPNLTSIGTRKRIEEFQSQKFNNSIW